MSESAINICTRAINLIGSVEQKRQLESQLNMLRIFKTRSTILEEALISLAEISNSITAMRQTAIPCPAMDDLVRSLVEQAKENQRKFADFPEWILDKTSTDFAPFMNKLKNMVTTIRVRLSQAWQQYLNLSIPRIQSETLLTFSRIEAFKLDIEAIKQHQLALSKLQDKIPQIRDITEAKRLCDNIRALWGKFGQGNVPDEVLEFLRLAGGANGAPVSLWTDTVQAWLTSQGIIGQCTIKI